MPYSSIRHDRNTGQLAGQPFHQRRVLGPAAGHDEPADAELAAGVGHRDRRDGCDGGDDVIGVDRPDGSDVAGQVGQVEQLLAGRLRWWSAVVRIVEQALEKRGVRLAATATDTVAVEQLGSGGGRGRRRRR